MENKKSPQFFLYLVMRLLNLVQESSFSFRLLCVCKVFDIEIYEDIIWDIISHSAYNYEKKQYIQSKLVLIPIPNHDDHEIFNSSNHYWLMQNIIQHHQYNDIQQPQFYLLFPILESYDELSLTASGMRSFFSPNLLNTPCRKSKNKARTDVQWTCVQCRSIEVAWYVT